METTIHETLKGLKIARDEREKRLQEIAEKETSQLVEEKRAELQKEMDAKLDEYIASIESEKEGEIAKIKMECGLIDVLIAEFEGKIQEVPSDAEEPVEENAPEEQEEADTVEETTETVKDALHKMPFFKK